MEADDFLIPTEDGTISIMDFYLTTQDLDALLWGLEEERNLELMEIRASFRLWKSLLVKHGKKARIQVVLGDVLLLKAV